MNFQKIKRGDIFYADLGFGYGSEQGGTRPVVVIQNDDGNTHSPTVIVAPLTTNNRHFIVHAKIENGTSCGLGSTSYAQLEQIKTIDKCRLKEYVGHLTEQDMQRIEEKALISLGIKTKENGGDERNMNDIQIFSNPKFGQLRTIEENCKILFVASDVTRSLGYVNSSKALSDHCKGVTKRYIPTNGGQQEMNVIPEGDIYRLAAKSELPGADKFESWIFDEVLPQIRKTGAYISTPVIDSKMLFQIAAQLEEKEKQIAALTPKANYYDGLVERELLLNFRDTAKELHMGQAEFIDWLLRKGFVYRDNRREIKPISMYVKERLFEMKEYQAAKSNHTGTQTLVTVKGRQKFISLLQREGALCLSK